MTKPIVLAAALLGVVLVVIAVVYFVQPAGSLPRFMPGYEPNQVAHHTKHGIGTLILGLGAFALAWFQSKSPKSV